MKRSSAELKKLARARLNGHWGLPIGAFLLLILGMTIVSLIVTTVIVVPSASSSDTNYIITFALSEGIMLIISLVFTIFSAGYNYLLLNFCRAKSTSTGDLLYAFKHHPDRFIVVSFLLMLVGLVCGLPGTICSVLVTISDELNIGLSLLSSVFSLIGAIIAVILTLGFTLSIQLLLDNPDMGAIESMKTSFQLMRGNKGRMIYIYLSFIGWMILSMFTCYIGLLWLIPYMAATTTYFYLDVTGELDRPHYEEPGGYQQSYQDSNEFQQSYQDNTGFAPTNPDSNDFPPTYEDKNGYQQVYPEPQQPDAPVSPELNSENEDGNSETSSQDTDDSQQF
jgi:uncharacterized membrane protein